MIDITLLRGSSAEVYKENILKKDPSFNVSKLLELDLSVRKLKSEVEAMLAEKKVLSQSFAKDSTARDKSLALNDKIEEKKLILQKTEADFEELLLCCPNFISDVVPMGNKESNLVVRSFGEKPDFSFLPKHHVELNQSLGWFDLQAGAQIAESGFVFYKEFGAKLIYALTRLMLRHNKKWGFTPVLPPTIVSQKSLWRNGSLPKFKGDYYDLAEDSLSLTPTAEVCLTNVHADKVFSEDELPLRNCAWTSCFRREAGGYGANERGLIRIHQFEKVELYSIVEPEKSNLELEMMVACGEAFLQELGLCYQVSLLAAQDCSFVSNKTYDIEVWLPGQNRFYEVSSCSNCTDYQARRAKIKYKKALGLKPEFVHTLNASSLALPRLMVALMENYQTPTGEVLLPEILKKEMDALW